MLQFNIINVIFVRDSNQFYSLDGIECPWLDGSWCQHFEKIMTLFP